MWNTWQQYHYTNHHSACFVTFIWYTHCIRLTLFYALTTSIVYTKSHLQSPRKDNIFSPHHTTAQVYENSAQSIIRSAANGINGMLSLPLSRIYLSWCAKVTNTAFTYFCIYYKGTIFAYGQTSSGKTHTMYGDDGKTGLVSLAVEEIFAHAQMVTYFLCISLQLWSCVFVLI